jgi:hypothetical protein
VVFVILRFVKKLVHQQLGLEALDLFVRVRLACVEARVQNLYTESMNRYNVDQDESLSRSTDITYPAESLPRFPNRHHEPSLIITQYLTPVLDHM